MAGGQLTSTNGESNGLGGEGVMFWCFFFCLSYSLPEHFTPCLKGQLLVGKTATCSSVCLSMSYWWSASQFSLKWTPMPKKPCRWNKENQWTRRFKFLMHGYGGLLDFGLHIYNIYLLKKELVSDGWLTEKWKNWPSPQPRIEPGTTADLVRSSANQATGVWSLRSEG